MVARCTSASLENDRPTLVQLLGKELPVGVHAFTLGLKQSQFARVMYNCAVIDRS